MKKIIHLSDLHIGHEDCGTKFRTIIDNIAFLKQPAENYIIVITGDIVDNANIGGLMDEAASGFELFENLGYRVLVAPGNHDYGTGTMGDEKFIDLFKKKYYKKVDISYPKLDIIDGVAFIALDSTAEELHWYDRFLSEGELGKDQLNNLSKMLNSPEIADLKKVIYLHHHPFDFKLGMQLRDSEGLKKIIENKADALLFGHYHVNPSIAGRIFHGVWGIPRCYNGGTSTHKNGNIGFQRVIDLSNSDPRMDYDGNFI